MRGKRQYRRFIRRLEVEFSSNDRHYRGVSSNFSVGGLFVRTNHPFAPGTLIDMNIHLPDGEVAALKGRVKMALKTPAVSLKNGMGVEIIEKDATFLDFVQSLSGEENLETEQKSPTEELPAKRGAEDVQVTEDLIIMRCPDCGAGNRVRRSKTSRALICGKCGASLPPV